MLQIEIDNSRTRVVGRYSADPNVCNAYHEYMRKALAYKVPGADFSPKYQTGLWDGYISLYERRTQSFPTGIVGRAMEALDELKVSYEVLDTRVPPTRNLSLQTRWAQLGRQLRNYQEVSTSRAIETTRGIVAVGTGGGKTSITAEIISRMSVAPVLLVVPSLSLLNQTRKELLTFLEDPQSNRPLIGVIGDNQCDINQDGVNIVTWQTALAAFEERYNTKSDKIESQGEREVKTTQELEHALISAKADHATAIKSAKITLAAAKADLASMRSRCDNKAMAKDIAAAQKKLDKEERAILAPSNTALKKAQAAWERRQVSIVNKKAIRDLFARAQALLIDEAHVAAVVIQRLSELAELAYFRVGFSATPYREDGQEIRIEAATGRKLIEVSPSDLIEAGYLVPPRIYQVRINHIEQSDGYPDAYKKHITLCWERNFRIKQCAEAFRAAGRPTAILVDRIEHGEVLEAMIADSVFVPGSDSGRGDEYDDPEDEELDYRRRVLNAVERNERIIIATPWLGTGVDAPKISCLIMAGSIKSTVSVYQYVGRVLRLAGSSYEESVRNGKADAVIIDFNDSQDAMHAHSVRRKRVFRSERAWMFKTVS